MLYTDDKGDGLAESKTTMWLGTFQADGKTFKRN